MERVLKTMILPLIAYFTVMTCGTEARADSSKIHLVVEQLSPRAAKVFETPQAIIGIRFKNEASPAVEIPFCTATGKGGDTLEFGVNRPNCQLTLEGIAQRTAAGMATVDYQWLNGDNNPVVSGSYSLSHEQIAVSTGDSSPLFTFPITMPASPGKYTVTLIFDNQILAMTSQGSNSHLIACHLFGAPALFRATTSAKVEIKSRQTSPTPDIVNPNQ